MNISKSRLSLTDSFWWAVWTLESTPRSSGLTTGTAELIRVLVLQMQPKSHTSRLVFILCFKTHWFCFYFSSNNFSAQINGHWVIKNKIKRTDSRMSTNAVDNHGLLRHCHPLVPFSAVEKDISTCPLTSLQMHMLLPGFLTMTLRRSHWIPVNQDLND